MRARSFLLAGCISFALVACRASAPVATQPSGELTGVWVDAAGRSILQVHRSGETLSVRFDTGSQSSIGGVYDADCFGAAPVGTRIEVWCATGEHADRTVTVELKGDAVVVTSNQAPPETLRRSTTMHAVVAPWVEATRHSDLGSSGGNIFFVMLGTEPARAAAELAHKLEAALRTKHTDPDTLWLDEAAGAMSQAEISLLQACKGGLPFATYEHGLPMCENDVVSRVLMSTAAGVGAGVSQRPSTDLLVEQSLSWAAPQTRCMAYLSSLYRAQRIHFSERDTYQASFNALMPSLRCAADGNVCELGAHVIWLGAPVADSGRRAAPSLTGAARPGISGECPECELVIGCGTNDGDPKSVWSIASFERQAQSELIRPGTAFHEPAK